MDAGEYCETLIARELRNLPCRVIEADEIWTYVRKKEGHLTAADAHDPEAGDQYTFIGLDPRSRLIAAHAVGRRDAETTTDFLAQLRMRIPGRLQLFTDGFPEYVFAVDGIFGAGGIDYAQVIKPLDGGGQFVRQIRGDPDHASTSLVERHNATMRQQIRRMTRKTLAFSKKLRNLRAAVALYVSFYNWIRPHGSLHGMTPAMTLGVASTVWSVDRLIP